MVEKHYYKSVRDGYIDHVGFGYGFPEMTEDEYSAIREKLLNAPEVGDGEEARLREDGTWEVKKLKEEQDNGSIEV